MRIGMNDTAVQYVKAVFLDGNHMPTAVEVDTSEGWVRVAVPRVDNAEVVTIESKVSLDNDNLGQHELDWEYKTLYGNVEVMWHDDTPTEFKVATTV